MAPYPEFTIDDLAYFTGRPEVTFPAHAEEALHQAAFFIKTRTQIKEYPPDSDPELQEAFKNAILDLGNRLYQEAQYDWILANPLSSETIGSYSYSKSNAARAALYTARPTGLMWLDLLLELLLQREEILANLPTHGSTHVFENDGVYLTENGERWVLGPAHIDFRAPGKREVGW